MKMYDVKVAVTVVKHVLFPAESAIEAISLAADMDDEDYDFCEEIGSNATATLVEKDENEDDDDDDPCDGFDDCDDCPNYCEVCGSCAKEADFVPNRGDCADCKHRCSACGACTADD